MRSPHISLVLALLSCPVGGLIASAQTVSPVEYPASAENREIAVAIKAAPPFAFKLEDGTWSGLSVELWRKVAEQTHLKFRFVEVPDVQAQLDGVAAGKFDAATAAITVTANRERAVDFTQPFYVTGLGVATSLNREASWRPIVNSLTSFGFLQAILALMGISLTVGVLLWLFERRKNEDFGGSILQGLFSSMWWSTIAATQASTGNFGPRTTPGRILAVIWMMGSIIAIAVFTAGVTSVLTVKQMEGVVQTESDLANVRVGNVSHSSTAAYLNSRQISHRGYSTVDDGLNALRRGTIDAFVYDRPLLSWLIGQNYAGSLQVIDMTFDEQAYAIALQKDSKLRERLNVALLDTLESDWWKDKLFQYLGDKQ